MKQPPWSLYTLPAASSRLTRMSALQIATTRTPSSKIEQPAVILVPGNITCSLQLRLPLNLCSICVSTYGKHMLAVDSAIDQYLSGTHFAGAVHQAWREGCG